MKQSHQKNGFTLIELMIVVAIIGILSSLGMSAFQTYTIRAQLAEGLSLATNAKAGIVSAFVENGEAPSNRQVAGLSAGNTDTNGNYVTAVQIVNGVVGVQFGNKANSKISGQWLYLTPYETADLTVVWRCGNSSINADLDPMGTGGGGNAALYTATPIDNQFLPASCR